MPFYRGRFILNMAVKVQAAELMARRTQRGLRVLTLERESERKGEIEKERNAGKGKAHR